MLYIDHDHWIFPQRIRLGHHKDAARLRPVEQEETFTHPRTQRAKILAIRLTKSSSSSPGSTNSAGPLWSSSSANSAVAISSNRRGVKVPCSLEANQPSSASQLASKASQRLRLGGRCLPLGKVKCSSTA